MSSRKNVNGAVFYTQQKPCAPTVTRHSGFWLLKCGVVHTAQKQGAPRHIRCRTETKFFSLDNSKAWEATFRKDYDCALRGAIVLRLAAPELFRIAKMRIFGKINFFGWIRDTQSVGIQVLPG